MMTFIKNFHNDEDGAVTVDWVVLTAAVVGLGIAAVTTVNTSIGGLSADIGATVDGTSSKAGLTKATD